MMAFGDKSLTLERLGQPLALDSDGLDFDLPLARYAAEPPEARGLARDEVRLMVSRRSDDRVIHAQFREIGDFLAAGDVVVINTSGTLNAALTGTREEGTGVEVHLSTHLPADLWIVEVRLPDGPATKPFLGARPGETISLPGGASVTLHTPYVAPRVQAVTLDWPNGQPRGGARLWVATLRLPDALEPYLADYGFPIRYSYVTRAWPSTYYQTVYANEMGSAEMPSAGRAFTPELLTRLMARGVHILPLVLHTGVSSLETHEPPYEEFYRVPLETARVVNMARAAGQRIIAVGTTVVRALETVTDRAGTVHPGEGWTTLIITPERGIRSVNGLLTGLHEPRATHLATLEALAGRHHLEIAYAAAVAERYLWHEFGDLHLILP